MNLLRKYLYALLVCVHLLSCFGIPVYYHYCGGELESISALYEAESCCGETEESENGCCQNELKVFIQMSDVKPVGKFTLVNIGTSTLPHALSSDFFVDPILNQEKCNTCIVPKRNEGREILRRKSVLII